MVNLRPVLEATEPSYRARLEELFTRLHFVLGEQVAGFEQEFAEALGARFAIGVGTGTAAIELCLREAGCGAGREVLTSALTAPFTGLAVLAAGCRPRFADVDEETLLMDPEDAANRASRKTAALIPVHLYGQPCGMSRWRKLASELEAVLIQDACQAHGALHRGKPLADFSHYVAYSFYPTKNLGCLGDGGAILTNSKTRAAHLRMLRDGGRRGDQVSWVPAINSRLDEMHACYLRAFLPHLKEWNAWRREIAGVYDEALAGCEGARPLRQTAETVNHLYVVRAARRDKLREHLSRKGVGTAIHYPVPLHLMPAFRDCGLKRGDLPRAEKACRQILSLPLWPYMEKDQALFVAEQIRAFYG